MVGKLNVISIVGLCLLVWCVSSICALEVFVFFLFVFVFVCVFV